MGCQCCTCPFLASRGAMDFFARAPHILIMRIKTLFLSLLALLPGCSSVSKYPQPAYTVEKISAAESPIEIRQYPPLLLAEMKAPDAGRQDAASAAFMPLIPQRRFTKGQHTKRKEYSACGETGGGGKTH